MVAIRFPGAVGQTFTLSKGGTNYQKTIAASVVAPTAYSAANAALTDGGDGTSLTLTISAVPADGGAARSLVEYNIDGGTWADIGFLGTGSKALTGLTTDQLYTVGLRSTNSAGTSTPFYMERAPVASVTAPAAYSSASARLVNGTDGTSLKLQIVAVPDDGGSPRTLVEYRVDGGSWLDIGFLGTGEKILSGLTTGQTYAVDLRSTNSAGVSTDYQMTAAPQAPAEPGTYTPQNYVRVGDTVELAGGPYVTQQSDAYQAPLVLADGSKRFVIGAHTAPFVAATMGGVHKVGDRQNPIITSLTGYPFPALTYQRLWNGSPISGDDETNPYYTPTATGTLTTTITATNEAGSYSTDPIVTVIEAETGDPTPAGVADPCLSCNIGNVNYYRTPVLLDIVKQIHQPQAYANNTFVMSITDCLTNGYLDANLYPVSLPPGADQFQGFWSFAETAGREYTVRWTGAGTVTFTGDVQNVSMGANSGTFERSTGTGQVKYRIVPPISNMIIVATDEIDAYDAGQRWKSEYIDLLRDMRLVRFLNASGVNGSKQVDWAERNTLDTFSYNSGVNNEPTDGTAFASKNFGIPIELQVELCNQLKCDGWFFVPRLASDDFVSNQTAYIRDNLDAGLKNLIEYGNEAWNPTLNGGQFNKYLWKEVFPTAIADGKDRTRIVAGAYAKRVAEVMTVVHATMAGSGRDYECVLGSQTSNSAIARYELEADVWAFYDPTGHAALWSQPQNLVSIIGITSYFGGATFIANNEMTGHKPGGVFVPDGLLTEAFYGGYFNEFLFDRLMQAGVSNTFPAIRGSYNGNNTVAADYGMKLMLYEGGQHLMHGAAVNAKNNNLGTDNVPGMTDALMAFCRNDNIMTELYTILFEMIRATNDVPGTGLPQISGPFMQYNELGTWSTSGCWTWREDFADRKGFSEALFAQNRFVGNWWGGATTGYEEA